MDFDEWERICNLGDNDPLLEDEQNKSWVLFFKNTIREGKIDEEILSLIDEGKNRVKKLHLKS